MDIDSDTATTSALTTILNVYRARAIAAGKSAEDTDTVIYDALTQGASIWIDRIRRSTKHRLAQSRRDRRSFERRLGARWGEALDAYEILWLYCTDLGSELQQRWAGRVLPLGGARYEALLHLHSRACLCAGACLSLLRAGYAIAAEAQWRTLHELAVVADLLSEADESICAAYLDHEVVSRLKTARRFQAGHALLGEEPLPDDILDRLEEEVTGLVTDHGKGFKRDWGWARGLFPDQALKSEGFSPTFDKLEDLAGLAHLSAYHAQSSSHIHGGARGAQLATVDFRGTRMMQAGPSNAGLADPAIRALQSLLQTTAALTLQPSLVAVDPSLVSKLEAASALVADACESFLQAHLDLEHAENSYLKAEASGRLHLAWHVGSFTASVWARTSQQWLNGVVFASVDTLNWLRHNAGRLSPALPPESPQSHRAAAPPES